MQERLGTKPCCSGLIRLLSNKWPIMSGLSIDSNIFNTIDLREIGR